MFNWFQLLEHILTLLWFPAIFVWFVTPPCLLDVAAQPPRLSVASRIFSTQIFTRFPSPTTVVSTLFQLYSFYSVIQSPNRASLSLPLSLSLHASASNPLLRTSLKTHSSPHAPYRTPPIMGAIVDAYCGAVAPDQIQKMRAIRALPSSHTTHIFASHHNYTA